MRKIIQFAKKPFVAYGIFWSWNILFMIVLITMESLGQFLISIIQNAFTGYTPVDFSLYSLLIFTIPIGAVIVALKKFRKKPRELLKFFYGVELPLWLVFILRISIFRELTPATAYLLFILTVGILAFFTGLVIHESKRPIWLKYALKFGYSVLAIFGAFIGIVLFFYSLPLLFGLISSLGKMEFLLLFKIGLFALLLGIFILYSWTILICLPVLASYCYIKTFINNAKEKLKFGKFVLFGSLGLNIILLVFLNGHQPQIYALQLLSSDMTTERKLEFIKNEDKVKEGLLNGYLNSYRYISSQDNNHITELYSDVVGLNRETAQGVQNVYNFFMSPFLYNGSMVEERYMCKELYEQYFDRSIQKHEAETIVSAMKATWDSDGIEAGLLNVNEEKVHIVKQEVNVKEEGSVAEIEIYEAYQNQTFDRQEIFYYLSLPPNSAITGLWLSDSAQYPKRYPFAVSPRGAAQKVYKEEVRRRVDPSLLEQVGPNQYRLRAFPIEPKTRDYGDNYRSRSYSVKEGALFHLWLSYKTISKNDAGWELPHLLEKRNVFWSENTERKVNGKIIRSEENWLPSHVKASSLNNFTLGIVNLNDSLSMSIATADEKDISFGNEEKMAIIVDGSYSMRTKMNSLKHCFKSLIDKGINESNTRLFVVSNSINELTLSDFYSELDNENSVLFFSSNTYTDILKKFADTEGKDYSVALMITDKGNYEAEKDAADPVILGFPFYMLHLDNEITPIYSDVFWESVKSSKGSIVGSVDEFLKLRAYASDSTFISISNNVLYKRINNKGSSKADPSMNEIAANMFIQNSFVPADSSQRLAFFDAIHLLALKEAIVTPFSSMIVLVDVRQKEALKKAEAQADRFDREVESGDEVLANPVDPFQVTGTPEPHEWILISLVLTFMLYLEIKRRKLKSKPFNR